MTACGKFNLFLWYCCGAVNKREPVLKCTECVRTFDAWCHVAQCASEQLQLCELSRPTFGFTTWEFCMVDGYTKNPEKPQNFQNWGVGTCLGQHGTRIDNLSTDYSVYLHKKGHYQDGWTMFSQTIPYTICISYPPTCNILGKCKTLWDDYKCS